MISLAHSKTTGHFLRLLHTGHLFRFAQTARLYSNAASNNEDQKAPKSEEEKQLPPARRFSLTNGLERLILRSRLTTDTDLSRFLARLGAYSIYGLTAVSALGTLGVDTSPILTGIGVTGFTVGFALKEVATNFLSGVLLVFSKPFRKGQYIKVLVNGAEGRMEGEVMSIDARYVLLKSKTGGRGKDEDAVVMVPAVVVYTNPIVVTEKVSATAAK